ncbi:hypothetical protein YC2023_043357 [Brassica napus]
MYPLGNTNIWATIFLQEHPQILQKVKMKTEHHTQNLTLKQIHKMDYLFQAPHCKTRIHAKTRYIPSFLFRKRSLSRERFCQARDFHFSSSLTTENGFNYAIVEAVGYEFKTIQLNQLVRRVLSCFDPKKFSVAVH